MAKRTNKTINELEAQGRLVATGLSETGTPTITLEIRDVDWPRNVPAPQFTFLCEGSGQIPRGRYRRIKVKGYIRGFMYYDAFSEERQYRQLFVATSYEEAKSEFATRFGLTEPDGYADDNAYMRLFLEGTVRFATDRDRYASLGVTVRTTDEDDRNNVISMAYYKGNRKLPKFDFKEGDRVLLEAAVTPFRTRAAGGRSRDNSLYIERIVTVDAQGNVVKHEKFRSTDANRGNRRTNNYSSELDPNVDHEQFTPVSEQPQPRSNWNLNDVSHAQVDDAYAGSSSDETAATQEDAAMKDIPATADTKGSEEKDHAPEEARAEGAAQTTAPDKVDADANNTVDDKAVDAIFDNLE